MVLVFLHVMMENLYRLYLLYLGKYDSAPSIKTCKAKKKGAGRSVCLWVHNHLLTPNIYPNAPLKAYPQIYTLMLPPEATLEPYLPVVPAWVPTEANQG